MTQTSQHNNSSPNEGIGQWVNGFTDEVRRLLLPNEYQGTALYKFLIQMARSYHLPPQEVDAILNEGVKRGVEYIQLKQEPIHQPAAWLRQTCLNIMRSRVDANIKHEKKTQKVTECNPTPPNPLEESELIEQLEFLEKALLELSIADQQLLRMKFWEDLTYKQIQYRYKLSDADTVPSIQALRKRESRALAKLRDSFFKIYEGVQETS